MKINKDHIYGFGYILLGLAIFAFLLSFNPQLSFFQAYKLVLMFFFGGILILSLLLGGIMELLS